MTTVFIEIVESVESTRGLLPLTAVVRDENSKHFHLDHSQLITWLRDNIPQCMADCDRCRWMISFSSVYFASASDAMMFKLAWHGTEISDS